MTPTEVGAMTVGQFRAFVAHMERVSRDEPAGPLPSAGGGLSVVQSPDGSTTRHSFRNPNPRAHTAP